MSVLRAHKSKHGQIISPASTLYISEPYFIYSFYILLSHFKFISIPLPSGHLPVTSHLQYNTTYTDINTDRIQLIIQELFDKQYTFSCLNLNPKLEAQFHPKKTLFLNFQPLLDNALFSTTCETPCPHLNYLSTSNLCWTTLYSSLH